MGLLKVRMVLPYGPIIITSVMGLTVASYNVALLHTNRKFFLLGCNGYLTARDMYQS